MRVMCICEYDPQAFDTGPDVFFGEIYTVIGELYGYGKNLIRELCYKFQETGINYCYPVKHFIPVSDIDEFELVNEKQLVNS